MSKTLLQFQVGLFVSLAIISFMVVVFLLGGEKKLFEDQYSLIAHFNTVSGLRTGSPVHLAGIHVGNVSQVRFLEDGSKKVAVVMKVSTKYQNRIREDSMASIETQGLLGDKMILLSIGNFEKRILQNGDLVLVQSSSDFGDLASKGQELIHNANSILLQVKNGPGLVHDLLYNKEGQELISNMNALSKGLQQTTKNLENITGKIDNGKGTVGALINDASLFNDMKTLLGKANRNKLVKAVVRYTLKTKDEKLLKKEGE